MLCAEVIIWFVMHNLKLLYVHEDRDITKQQELQPFAKFFY